MDNPDGVEPIPDSSVIYFTSNKTTLHGFNKDASLPFKVGKRYRLRIINVSTLAMFAFWIDGHRMDIVRRPHRPRDLTHHVQIEVDGINVETHPVDVLSLSVAQRYSVLVTARDEADANWAIHANMDPAMFDEIPPSLQMSKVYIAPSSSSIYHCSVDVTATVVYSHDADSIDKGVVSEYYEINDMELVPLEPKPIPPADSVIELLADLSLMTDGTNRGHFNQITYTPPLVPALFSVLSLGHNATYPEPYGPSTYVLEHMEVVDIIIKNADDNQHPLCVNIFSSSLPLDSLVLEPHARLYPSAHRSVIRLCERAITYHRCTSKPYAPRRC